MIKATRFHYFMCTVDYMALSVDRLKRAGGIATKNEKEKERLRVQY